MPSIRIWTPESNFDSKAVRSIDQKIIEHHDSDVSVLESSKEAFNQAVNKGGQDGLRRAVDIYLNSSELVIFLLDADGVQAQAQRQQEPNSLINRIRKVVGQSKGKALLVLMRQELEAWLLVDCLGICCYYTKNSQIRSDRAWIKFAQQNQKGDTQLITEAESGGKGVKEHLAKFSEKILKKINPKLKTQDLKGLRYQECDSTKIAMHIEINNQTIERNESLKQFSQYFK